MKQCRAGNKQQTCPLRRGRRPLYFPNGFTIPLGTAGNICGTFHCTNTALAPQRRRCSLKAKTQQTVGTLLNLSSEDILLIQHQLQKERTYSALYLYGT